MSEERINMPGDAERLVAWIREGADELEKAHAILDGAGIPRSTSAAAECTLAARIALLLVTYQPLPLDRSSPEPVHPA